MMKRVKIAKIPLWDVSRRAMQAFFGSPIPLSLNFCSIYKALIQKRIKAVTVEKRNEKWKETS